MYNCSISLNMKVFHYCPGAGCNAFDEVPSKLSIVAMDLKGNQWHQCFTYIINLSIATHP